MKRRMRSWKTWILLAAVLAVAVLVPVLAQHDEVSFIATPYSDVVRFESRRARIPSSLRPPARTTRQRAWRSPSSA